MMYGAETELSVHGTQSPEDSDSDDEPRTLPSHDVDSSDNEDDSDHDQKSSKTRELECDDSTLSY